MERVTKILQSFCNWLKNVLLPLTKRLFSARIGKLQNQISHDRKEENVLKYVYHEIVRPNMDCTEAAKLADEHAQEFGPGWKVRVKCSLGDTVEFIVSAVDKHSTIQVDTRIRGKRDD